MNQVLDVSLAGHVSRARVKDRLRTLLRHATSRDKGCDLKLFVLENEHEAVSIVFIRWKGVAIN